jgi:hypothetical protein
VRRTLEPAAAVAALVAVVGAALLGWQVGDRRSGTPAGPPSPTARIGPASMVVPPHWRPIPVSRTRLELGDGVAARAFEVAPGLPARAVVLVGPPADATLLPAALRDAGRDRPRAVTLAGNPAWRYPESRRPDGRHAEATVLPTSAGVIAVGCLAPSFAWAAAAGCAAEIERIRLEGARVLPPDDSAALRLVLPPKIAELRAARARHRQALARARTGAEQAGASRALAAVLRRTADSLSPFAPATRQRRLVAALRRTAGAYRRLATAAAGGRPRAYARARVMVVRAEQSAGAALARVWTIRGRAGR